MKKLLVVVDYQNDFVDGALGFPGAEILDKKIAAKIAAYRGNGDEVVFTFDTHAEDYLKTQEGLRLPIAHCIKDSDGWNLFGETAAFLTPDSPVFLKTSFGSPELGEFIGKGGYDEIEFVGLVSNMCVLSNAVIAKAADPEARIIIDASCTDSFDPILNEKALDVMQALHMDVVNREEQA